MKVYRAISSDYPQVNQLLAMMHSKHQFWYPHLFKSTSEFLSEKMYEDLLEDPNWFFLVAEGDQEAAGIVVAQKVEMQETSLDRTYTNLVLEFICVKESHQRLGIGTRLIEECKELSKQIGADSLSLTTWAKNTAAKDFFLHMGFSELRTIYELRWSL